MTTTPHDDAAARRAYWISQLEEAHAFMTKILDYPVKECGEKMVALEPAARESGVEVEYSTKPHVLGLPRLYYLREGQMAGFIGAARDMNRRGWVMRVEDGFRTRQMQKFLGRAPYVFDAILKKLIWELDGKLPTPEFFLRRSMTLVALMPKIGTHMSGSAIDISVLERDRRGSDGQRVEIDRGGPYIEMSEKTPMKSPFVTEQQRRNRLDITAIMRAHQWVEYPFEFWHYNFGDAYGEALNNTGKPGRYGAIDWNPQDNRITPIINPNDPLNSPDEIRGEIEAALKRIR